MEYQEFVEQNKIKLESFCSKYFKDNFNSNKTAITEDTFINLAEYTDKVYNEYKKTGDDNKLHLMWKLAYLDGYLTKLYETLDT